MWTQIFVRLKKDNSNKYFDTNILFFVAEKHLQKD